MATQTTAITKQASPQTINIPLQAVTSTPTTKIWQQTITAFQCICPARDTPVCRHNQNIISTTTIPNYDEETQNTGFYLRMKGQPQRHIDWEDLMEENTWARCARWAKSSFPQQYTNPPERHKTTKRIHTITGLCDFCLIGHRGLYSSDITRVEDELANEEDSYTRGSSRSSSRTRQTEDDEAFEMVDYDMEDSISQPDMQTPPPSPSSFILGLKSIPSFTDTLYGTVTGRSRQKKNNKNKRRSSSCSSYSSSSSESGSDREMEEEPDMELDIINNFEEEIGLLELDDKTEGNDSPLDLEPEVWINHP